MNRERNLLLFGSLAAFGLLFILAAWAYGGRLFPEIPAAGASIDERSAFYMEIVIWVATFVTATLFLLSLRSNRDGSER